MKYTRKNNKNSLEIMKEEKDNLITDDFDTSEYLDEEFTNKRKLFRGKKQEYEYIIDEDAEEEKVVKKVTKPAQKKEKTKEKKTTKKKETKEEPILTIEPIRKVTKEEYKDITKKRQEEKERQLKLEQEAYEKKQKKTTKKKKNKSKEKKFQLDIKMIINAIFVVILFIIAITVVDIVSVSKYEKGPYFAINTATYNDGGTKIYHGIGYKVIKYNQLQGRRDMEIGTWSLKYNIEPITISDIDLAIEFNNDEETTYNNYYKKFVRINSTLKKINKNNNSIIIGYEDEDGKYTMDIICRLANNVDLDELEIGKETTIIGTIKEFNQRTSTTPITLRISDCFVEQ